MADLEEDLFVGLFITTSVCHKVVFFVYVFLRQVLGDNSPWVSPVSSCLVSRGTNCLLFLIIFSSMFV